MVRTTHAPTPSFLLEASRLVFGAGKVQAMQTVPDWFFVVVVARCLSTLEGFTTSQILFTPPTCRCPSKAPNPYSYPLTPTLINSMSTTPGAHRYTHRDIHETSASHHSYRPAFVPTSSPGTASAILLVLVGRAPHKLHLATRHIVG